MLTHLGSDDFFTGDRMWFVGSKPRQRRDRDTYLGGGVVVSGRADGLGVTPVTDFGESQAAEDLTWKQTRSWAAEALSAVLEGPHPCLSFEVQAPFSHTPKPRFLSNRLVVSQRPPGCAGHHTAHGPARLARRPERLLGSRRERALLL